MPNIPTYTLQKPPFITSFQYIWVWKPLLSECRKIFQLVSRENLLFVNFLEVSDYILKDQRIRSVAALESRETKLGFRNLKVEIELNYKERITWLENVFCSVSRRKNSYQITLFFYFTKSQTLYANPPSLKSTLICITNSSVLYIFG